MITTILNWLAGPAVKSIGEQLNAAYRAKLEAQNDEDRIAAEITIAQLEARQGLLMAEQGHWLTRWIRPAFALPFVLYVWKVVVWDKILGLGTTDALSSEMGWVLTTLVGAYFLVRPFEKIVRK